MKNFLLTILMLISALFVGCQTDLASDSIVEGNIANGEGVTTLTISTTEATRTVLGEKSGDTYPLYWSEGDRIAANGVQSEPAVINEANAASAQFTFSTAINYPFSVTYPYTSTSTASAPKVVFPAEQSYAEGTFATQSVPMCGYLANGNAKIEMKHLAGILRFAVKSAKTDVVLEKIVITSSGAKLAGEFNVDCANF